MVYFNKKNCSLFIWSSNLIVHPVFYLATTTQPSHSIKFFSTQQAVSIKQLESIRELTSIWYLIMELNWRGTNVAKEIMLVSNTCISECLDACWGFSGFPPHVTRNTAFIQEEWYGSLSITVIKMGPPHHLSHKFLRCHGMLGVPFPCFQWPCNFLLIISQGFGKTNIRWLWYSHLTT